MALGTTTKPRGREEYDLDIVLEVLRFWSNNPMDLYNWLMLALREHDTYRKMLEPKKRCARLNYAGDFHMDIMSARRDLNPRASRLYREFCVEVPDTSLVAWCASNPRGYAQWFEDQCGDAVLRARLDQQPLPANQPAHRKAILQQVVQLVKRQRAMWFGEDDEDAPRSVILTTLSALFYQGEDTLFAALSRVLRRVLAALPPTPPILPNPTNAEEILSESWVEKPAAYDAFVRWWRQLQRRVDELPSLRFPAIDVELQDLFGEVAKEARGELTHRVEEARRADRLRASRAGLTTAPGVGSAVLPNTFFGGDHG
jgi:hypothetical protein